MMQKGDYVICRLTTGDRQLYSTFVECSLQIHLFMHNEPNFRKSQMNVSDLLTREYEEMDTWSSGKNEPKTNPICQRAKMNINKVLTKDYENKSRFWVKSKQSQFKPKQTQFHLSSMLNCAICSDNTSTGPGKFRESADTYYDIKNTLEKRWTTAMIVHSVASMTFRPKGNSNSRSKYAFEVDTIQFGGKP